jgi:hypothetical protein
MPAMGALFQNDAGCRMLGDDPMATELIGPEPQAGRSGALFAIHLRLREVGESLRALAGSWLDAAGQDRARRNLTAESAALRSALLYQHPADWRDALLLAHYLSEAHARGEGESAPVAVAAETLFNFLASHVDVDHEPLGEYFQDATLAAYIGARHRLGRFEI